MSRVPGEPLGTRPATDARADAIAAALSRLHHALPAPVLGTAGQAGYGDGRRHVSDRMRELAAACRAELLDPLPRQAYDCVLAWLESGHGHVTRTLRRLHAAHWVMILLPGGSANHHNPRGVLERQVSRTLELLG